MKAQLEDYILAHTLQWTEVKAKEKLSKEPVRKEDIEPLTQKTTVENSRSNQESPASTKIYRDEVSKKGQGTPAYEETPSITSDTPIPTTALNKPTHT